MDAGQRLLELLWAVYRSHVPYAAVYERLAGASLVNDHVAFRTLQRRGGGVGPVAALFERLGWRRAGTYEFPDAHLSAIHLSRPGFPRVFVSELRQDELSARARELLRGLPADPPPPSSGDPAELAAWFAGPGTAPDEASLLELERESQYAAWLLLFGREVNHFTAAVDDVESWAGRLAQAGVPMKGEVEGDRGAPLRQTATRAAPRRVKVQGGEREWPYAYLELAQRAAGFDGFVVKQARELFEMTRR